MNFAEESLRSYACPFCLQPVGERCKTGSGKTCPTHVARWEPLSIAFGEGYGEGQRDTKAREPLDWYDLMRQHTIAGTRSTSDGVGEFDRIDTCSCGTETREDDGGFAGHLVDVLHDNDMVVARLA